MSVVDSPQQRPSTGSGGSGESRGASWGAPFRRWPLSAPLTAVVLCVLLGALSAAVLPTVPSYDPWSWIVWGHEVVDPNLNFIVRGGPSWKPLPVMFTTVWGLFGGASPTLWVITARIGGLLGLWGAWRVASRLTGGGWAGALAGMLATIGVLLTQDWFYYFLRGTSEVMLIGTTVWFVDRLLEGRRTQAFLIAIAASLIRPEWWPFIGLYALWLLWRDPSFRRPLKFLMLLGGGVAIPALWFGPPWATTGHPFLAATQAAEYNGHLGSDVLRAVVSRGIDDQVLPALIAGIIAVVIGWWRDRDRAILGVGLGVVGWWVVVVGETLKGYPGLERFFLPGAALTCVLGGVGIVRLAQLAAELVAGRGRLPTTAGASRAGSPAVLVAVAVILVAVSVPLTTDQIATARSTFPAASRAVSTLDELDKVVAAVGGHDAVYPCKQSFAAVNHSVQTAMAWKLDTELEHVGTKMVRPGVDFIGPHNATDGGAAPVDPRLTRRETLARLGGWRVLRLTTPGLPTRCDGR